MTTTSAYNFVNMTNSSSFQNFINIVNNSSEGYFFTMINFLVTIVLFITLTTGFGWESGLLSSLFIGMILSILFVYMNVMNIQILYIFIGLILVLIAYIIWSNKYD